MSSFIGCKISLISKAGIRYEGILYTIDPKESTVALSKVKSFGTEDRKVERVIPPREEIYEYIIFRGSDIADINVCEPSKEMVLISEDSAIVRAETSSTGNLGVLSSGISPNDGWNSVNHRPLTQLSERQVVNVAKTVQVKKELEDRQINHVVPPIGTSSRIQQQNNESSKKQPPRKEKVDMGDDGKVKSGKTDKIQQQKPMVAEKYSLGYHDVEYNQDFGYRHHGGSYRGMADYGNSRDYYYQMKPAGRYRRDQRRDQQHYFNDNGKLRGFESSDPSREYYSQFFDYRSSRGNNQQEKHIFSNPNRNKRRPTRDEDNKKEEGFKEDYDFESANAIIAKELESMSILADKKDQQKQSNEENENDDGEMSDNSDILYYDKTKSFFDNISSEVTDRANGKTVRPMNRKEERKMNVETFGVAEPSKNRGHSGSKWNRGGGGSGGRYYSGGRSGKGGSNYAGMGFRGNVISDGGNAGGGGHQRFKEFSHKSAGNSNRGYTPGRRPMPVGGPGRGDDY